MRLWVIALALAGAATAALAQPDGSRGSVPPGESRDQSKSPDDRASVTGRRQPERCRQLAGALREQCLRDLGSAGGGDSAVPQRASPAPVQRDLMIDPPPQNPRQ